MSITTMSEIITFIATVTGAFWAVHAFVKKTVISRLDSIDERLSRTESWDRKQQADLDYGSAERALLIKANMFLLKKMEQYPLNGEVKALIKEMDDHIFEQSRRMVSNFGGGKDAK